MKIKFKESIVRIGSKPGVYFSIFLIILLGFGIWHYWEENILITGFIIFEYILIYITKGIIDGLRMDFLGKKLRFLWPTIVLLSILSLFQVPLNLISIIIFVGLLLFDLKSIINRLN